MKSSAGREGGADTFEFEALREARNYRESIVREFSEHLRGRTLEVGAGIGQMTFHLRQLPAIARLLSIEPDPRFCQEYRRQFPDQPLLEGTAADLGEGEPWDAILSVNVLEHVRDDAGELRTFARLLRPRTGRLCLLVPARPEIYAPIDRDFGHYRRYRRRELGDKLAAAGFSVLRLHYFNAVGYFAWWLNFCVLRRRVFDVASVRLFDRVIFPWVHRFESRVCRPPFGQSLIAVATPGDAGME